MIFITIWIVILVGLLLLVYRRWLASETQQATIRKRKELERVMQLTHDLSKRGPTGFDRTRRVS